MSKKKNFYLQEMERYLSFLGSLSDHELFRLQNGDISIRFEISNNKRNSFSSNIEENREIDVASIIEELYKINSRDDGEMFLRSKCTNKLDFELVAKKLDVPFQKKDSIEKIKNKIIEGTIGFRLRSQAIQGNSD